jgi:hypothetical protein
MTAWATHCQTCRREFSPEQVAAGLTEHIHHELQGDVFRAATEGPCALCGTQHSLYGPSGKPLCNDCDPNVTISRCHVCRLPLLYEDAAIDGCHATCLPEEDA